MKKDFEKLQDRLTCININRERISKEFIESYKEDFDIRFSHESTKMEGNTLSIFEVKTLLVDNLSVPGKALREIYEVLNCKKAFEHIEKCIDNKIPLSEEVIKDIHELLVDNIFSGGIYRTSTVYISGASFVPPDWTKLREEMHHLVTDYEDKKKDTDPIWLSSWLHAEFVKIHPFPDGNGRTARLLLNFALMENAYLPIIIPTENRAIYYEALDNYAVSGELNPFIEIVYEQEERELRKYEKTLGIGVNSE